MPEPTTPETTPVTPEPAATPAPSSTPMFTPEQQAHIDRMMQDRVARAKPADYEDLKAKAARADELEASKLSDIEKANRERDEARTAAAEAKAENMRLKVANDKGLTGDKAFIADLLKGKDEDEMGEVADKLLALMPAPTPEPDPAATPAPDLHQGARPPAPSTDDAALEARWLNEGFGIPIPTQT